MVVFFDLDGTLTDPFEGITRSVQFALAHFGIDVADRTELAPYIGPPLRESFIARHGLSDEQADEALRQYRVRFSDVGMFENRVYDGVEMMLRALREQGVRLAVATSKPTVFSVKILEHFGLAHYFEEIVGSELSGHRVEKAEVIAEAMMRLNVSAEDVWMVGDRCFDIEGAHQNGMRAVGVRYGYAETDELERAEAEHIVDTVEQLQRFLLEENEK
ncbi:MAG: HAD family hydrolase [Ruminococcaceae bacterium]|nr:HAD family hydrolase [Oscillospiraceae bacterium]